MNWFDRSEVECRCGCGFDSLDGDLNTKLNRLREHFDVPVYISSGNRCSTHNHRIGGEPNSFHKRGRAVDIKVKGVKPNDVADWLERTFPDCCGIGRYNSFTHFDNRPNPVRWNNET